jgi:hypothetical protein
MSARYRTLGQGLTNIATFGGVYQKEFHVR